MNVYTDEIEKTLLFKRFESMPSNFDEITEAEVKQLQGIVLDIAEKVGPMMKEVGNTFRQYTDHSLTHLCNIANIIHKFLPESQMIGKDCIGLNALELTLLWAGILLHDVGMFVTEQEKEEALKTVAYRRFRLRNKERVEAADRARKAEKPRRAQEIEEALIAEFYRRGHARRSNEFVVNHLNPKFTFRGVDLVEAMGIIAESHNWRVFQRDAGLSNDPYVAQLDVEELFGNAPVNMQYIACCLRMGDIMDFDRSRTPLVIFENMDFTEGVSLTEWNKHLSVKGWKVTPTELIWQIECERPEYYIAVQEFLGWVDTELESFSQIVEGFKENMARRYPMPLPHRVKRDKVRMKNPNHITGEYKYQLEFGEIMQLLMDKSLYPDPALFLRELLQNSLDACRYQKALAIKEGMADKYDPRIDVWDFSDDPQDPRIVFRDNGYGMDLRTIEQYFLRVGKSYYRSPDFALERELLAEQGIFLDSCSRFGIGFLSCFLAGDNIEVETYRLGAPNALKINISGPSRYFLIEKVETRQRSTSFLSPKDRIDDGPPGYPGTKVTVHLKQGWRDGFEATEQGVVIDTINTYAVATEFPIMVHLDSGNKFFVITSDAFNNPRFPKPHYDAERFQGNPLNEILKLISIPLPRGDDKLKFSGGLWALMFNDSTRYGGRAYKDFRLALGGGYRAEPEHFITFNLENKFLSLFRKFQDFLKGFTLYDGDLFSEESSDGRGNRYSLNLFIECWNGLTSQEKLIAKGISKTVDFQESEQEFDFFKLYNAVERNDHCEIVSQLIGEDIYFDDYPGFELENEKIALHGILTPGGIFSWKPLEGYSMRDSLLPPEIFASVNIFGGGAPIPNASRLYLTPDDAKDIKKLLNISVIEWAIEGVRAHEGDNHWRDFFRRLYDYIEYHSIESILGKMEELADLIGLRIYLFQDDSIVKSLTTTEVFGDLIGEEMMLGRLHEIFQVLEKPQISPEIQKALLQRLKECAQLMKKHLGLFAVVETFPGNLELEITLEHIKSNKSRGVLFDYIVQLADMITNHHELEVERNEPRLTIREAIQKHKAILPVANFESSRPQIVDSYEDLEIFSEAPIFEGQGGQPYRDLREWVKKYLPSMRIEEME